MPEYRTRSNKANARWSHAPVRFNSRESESRTDYARSGWRNLTIGFGRPRDRISLILGSWYRPKPDRCSISEYVAKWHAVAAYISLDASGDIATDFWAPGLPLQMDWSLLHNFSNLLFQPFFFYSPFDSRLHTNLTPHRALVLAARQVTLIAP